MAHIESSPFQITEFIRSLSPTRYIGIAVLKEQRLSPSSRPRDDTDKCSHGVVLMPF